MTPEKGNFPGTPKSSRGQPPTAGIQPTSCPNASGFPEFVRASPKGGWTGISVTGGVGRRILGSRRRLGKMWVEFRLSAAGLLGIFGVPGEISLLWRHPWLGSGCRASSVGYFQMGRDPGSRDPGSREPGAGTPDPGSGIRDTGLLGSSILGSGIRDPRSRIRRAGL